jgi:hypothetical protein
MYKLSQYFSRVKQAGAAEAMYKLANPAVAHIPPRGVSRLIPKTRLGRLGALGAIGAGALALGNRKEDTFVDKATNYINSIDPNTINTAMGLYSQLAMKPSMGYASDPTMGVDYAEPQMPVEDEEYLDDYTKTSSIKLSNNKYYNILKGALGGAGVGAVGIGAGTAGSGLLRFLGDSESLVHSGLNNLSNMGFAGLAAGAGAGGVGAFLSRARKAGADKAIADAVKSTEKSVGEAVSKASSSGAREAARYAPSHSDLYLANMDRMNRRYGYTNPNNPYMY